MKKCVHIWHWLGSKPLPLEAGPSQEAPPGNASLCAAACGLPASHPFQGFPLVFPPSSLSGSPCVGVSADTSSWPGWWAWLASWTALERLRTVGAAASLGSAAVVAAAVVASSALAAAASPGSVSAPSSAASSQGSLSSVHSLLGSSWHWDSLDTLQVEEEGRRKVRRGGGKEGRAYMQWQCQLGRLA